MRDVVNYNSELENIDTPEKAYILGLYYADGYVLYKPQSHDYFSSIALKNYDEEILNKIQESLPIFIIEKRANEMISIRLNKKKACEDLIKNGVLPNKSSINKNKVRFPDISPELYPHFIRGYFDGDGSIFFVFQKEETNAKGFTFTGNNYFLMKKIKEILFYEGINMKLTYRRGGNSVIRGTKITFKSLTFSLECRRMEMLKIASKYLYTDALLYMKRKYDIFNTWYDKYQEYYTCPRCGYSKARSHGEKRIICKKCNRSSLKNKTYYDYLKPKSCKYCNSVNIVGSGFTKSKITKEVVSRIFLCKNCKRTTSIKLCAP